MPREYDDAEAALEQERRELLREEQERGQSPFDRTLWLTHEETAYELPRYNIYDHLRAGGVLLVVAPPKSGKSFAALEVAWAVSSGRKFLGQFDVDVRGPVIYIAGEGSEETSGRLVARHRASGEPYPPGLGLYPHPHDLRDPAANAALLAWALPHTPAILIFDTVSRCGGGKEDAEDLTKLVAGVTLLNQELRATIVLLHHTPKSDETSSRGHTSLPAAVDAQWIMNKNDGIYTITTSFARSADDEEKPFAAFRVENVVLGTNEDGREVGYGAAVPCEVPEKPKRETRKEKARRLVEDEGLSGREAARRLKVTEGTIRNWLRKSA